MGGLGYRVEERKSKYYAVYNYKGYTGELEIPGDMIESYQYTITYPDNPKPPADVDRSGDEGYKPPLPPSEGEQ